MTGPPSCLPPRAARWQLRSRTIEFGRLPCVMGILNVTPDSFSDGGRHDAPRAAFDHARWLIDEGAEVIDVGGESTRPYAHPVDAAEELRRVVPVLEKLIETGVPISIDTSKAEVARRALEIGAEIVNDVTGLEGDPEMLNAVLGAQAGVCLMHMQGTPLTMQDQPSYEDVESEVADYLQGRVDDLTAAGVAASRICIDPGIGFGKTRQHNFDLLASCWKLHRLGCPVLVGHSRKGFLGKVAKNPRTEKLLGTVGVALSLALQGVQVLRVHDVGETVTALRLFDAAGGLDLPRWQSAWGQKNGGTEK